MNSDGDISYYWDNYDLFVVDYDPKEWEAILDKKSGEIRLHRKPSKNIPEVIPEQ